MAFNQRCTTEIVVKGGLLAAFNNIELAITFAKNYSQDTNTKIGLLVETENSSIVDVMIIESGKETVLDKLDTYQDAWIWAQQQLR